MRISWVDLRERLPIDISRLVSHSQGFNSAVGVRISVMNLDNAKKSLMDARVKLDLMIISLQQLLYDRTILKGRTDEVLYGWLIDNIGRYLKTLDEKEEDLLIKFDEVNSPVKRVGVSRLSAYSKALKLASESLVYQSLFKSIEEYENIPEEGIKFEYDDIEYKDIKENGKNKTKKTTTRKEITIRKEPRTFLYILFQVLQVTLSLLGGLAREGKPMGLKKGSVGNYPTTWQSLMTSQGQKDIAKKHEETTGEKIEIDESMIDNFSNEESEEIDGNTIYYEETEEVEEWSVKFLVQLENGGEVHNL